MCRVRQYLWTDPVQLLEDRERCVSDLLKQNLAKMREDNYINSRDYLKDVINQQWIHFLGVLPNTFWCSLLHKISKQHVFPVVSSCKKWSPCMGCIYIYSPITKQKLIWKWYASSLSFLWLKVKQNYLYFSALVLLILNFSVLYAFCLSISLFF